MVGLGATTLASWDVATGKGRAASNPSLFMMFSTVRPVVSLDGGWIATAADRGKAQIWDGADLTLKRTIDAHDGSVQGMLFSADGRRLASASTDDDVLRLWNVADGTKAAEHPLGRDPSQLVVQVDGGGLFVCGRGGGVVLGLSTPTPFRDGMQARKMSRVDASAFAPHGRAVAVVDSADKRLFLFDLEASREHRSMPGRKVKSDVTSGFPAAVQILPLAGGTQVAVRSFVGRPRRMDLATGKQLESLGEWPEQGPSPPAAASPDAATLYVGGKESVETIRTADGTRTTLPVPVRFIKSLAVSPDGGRLAVGGWGGPLVGVVDLASGASLWTSEPDRATTTCLAYSADGARLASGRDDGLVVLWNAADGKELNRVQGLEGKVVSIAFSPDGRQLAVAAKEEVDLGEVETKGVLALFRVEDGKRQATLQGHRGPAAGAVFSPDGRLLISAGADQRLHVWDAASAAPMHSLAGMERPATHVTKSLDGESLLVLDQAGTAKWWKFADLVAPPEEVEGVVRTERPEFDDR